MEQTISKEQAEMIFREQANYIYRVALFLTRSKELAEDIAQETFIQAFRKYDTFDAAKPLKPWLHQIALNLTRNALRKQKWQKLMGKIPESISLDLVESRVLRSEAKKELWHAIYNLGFKSREVIVLHFYVGMTLKGVAQTVGIPIGTCKSRLNSALNSLHRNPFYF